MKHVNRWNSRRINQPKSVQHQSELSECISCTSFERVHFQIQPSSLKTRFCELWARSAFGVEYVEVYQDAAWNW